MTMIKGKRPSPTREELMEIYDYRDDGKLVWKRSTSNVVAGTVAGYQRLDGQYRCTIKGRKYLMHRLIMQFHSVWEVKSTDAVIFVNGDCTNTRIANLRVRGKR